MSGMEISQTTIPTKVYGRITLSLFT